ncbi:energy-coupling factor ABC transporter ATP-binding protein [Bacillaceae bacterium S4-13-58]
MDIIFDKVGYTYQPNTPFEHRALNEVSFHIPSGAFFGIIGHTGSGKSTLIQHLNGLLKPTEGQVKIGDFVLTADEKPKNLKDLRQRVGVVFQYPEHQLFEETVKKDIAFGPKNFGVPEKQIENRILEAIEAVGLSKDLLDRSPFDLSGGQMRRVAIAGVLAMKPKILVLDEPTAGLDPRGHFEIMEMFSRLHKEQSLTTVLVTHSMEDALTYTDEILIMNQGQMVTTSKPLDLFKGKEFLREVGLDVPEVIDFIRLVETRFQVEFDFEKYSIHELAVWLRDVVERRANQ